MEKITISKKYRLSAREIANGFFSAAGVSILLAVQQSLDAGVFVFCWKDLAMAGLGGGLYYIIRKFVGKPKVTVTTATNADAESLKNNLK